MKKKLVIFDLDGTLLNTIDDLAESANYSLRALGYPTHDAPTIRSFVGNGINKLIERSLPDGEKTEENIMRMRSVFIPYYDAHNADFSVPYAGIPNVLTNLHAKGIMLAVASNKYQAGTEALIKRFFGNFSFVSIL
jgi:phosphoglycolate phosphatase